MSQVFKPPRHPGDPRETTDISIRETGRPVPIPRPARIARSSKFRRHSLLRAKSLNTLRRPAPELPAFPNFAVIFYYGASL